MIGVATPEETACGSAESAAGLGTLEPITVSYEPSLGKDEDEDADGNAWAYITAGAGVSPDIGLWMVRDGYALASYPEGELALGKYEPYETVGKTTPEGGLGNWATCRTLEN